MSHEKVPKEQKDALKITENLVRLSVGLENVDDLIEDLSNALSCIWNSITQEFSVMDWLKINPRRSGIFKR